MTREQGGTAVSEDESRNTEFVQKREVLDVLQGVLQQIEVACTIMGM